MIFAAALATVFQPFPVLKDAEVRRLGFDPSRLQAIRQRLDEAVLSRQIAGSVVIVSKGDQIVLHHATGQRDRAAGLSMKPDTLFQVMSMTKPFVGVAVVQCAERGLLNLDDPVEMYLPGFSRAQVRTDEGLEPAVRRVNIRHLLTHTSGLSGDDPGGLDDDQKRRMTLAEYAALIGADPLRAQPGEEIRYSGVGINALARIVEMASGQKFEDFTRDHIFQPCGMSDTSFFLSERDRSRLAKVYEEGLEEFAHDRFRAGAKLANGAGGLYSTALDMARFLMKFSKQGGGLVSPAGFRALTTLQSGELKMDGNSERGYGLAFVVVRNPAGTSNLRAPGAYGHTGAFCTEFWADPETGVVAVFMSQGYGVGDGVRKSFGAMVSASTLSKD